MRAQYDYISDRLSAIIKPFDNECDGSSTFCVWFRLQCEFFALEGLSQLLETVGQVRDTLNPDLEIQGIVMTMYDSRNKLAHQVVADVRENLGEKVYHTLIPRNVRVSEAPSYGKPAILYDLACSGSQAYLKLASEVIQRERSHKAA
ncbi:ParA family protein [Psychrosphaera aquimarina]|uniref:ParA family protein n=1 Tax=Psychrosphaera aquimarina TaxID=2044854 RepID=A0ABU3QZ33_9GAMM|nr:ParA family protein [Psychrosphaera aquimarina]MDU0112675.1 ParA family protein [Psychrosphaera aquimarina]